MKIIGTSKRKTTKSQEWKTTDKSQEWKITTKAQEWIVMTKTKEFNKNQEVQEQPMKETEWHLLRRLSQK